MTTADLRNIRSLVLAGHLVTFTITVGTLYLLSGVLIPVVLGVVLAFVLNPVVMRLQRWGFRRVPAVAATIVSASALIGGLILLVGLQIVSLANDLPKYKENIRIKVASVRAGSQGGALDRVRDTLRDVVEDRTTSGPISQRAVNQPLPARIVNDDGLLSMAMGPLRAIEPLLESSAKGLLALILTIFMLIRREDLRNRLVSFAMSGSLTTTTKALDEAGHRISRYMIMQLIINGIFGATVGLGLFFIGVPYALLWGLGAALLRYVPYVGAWMAAAAPLAVSFVTMPGWTAMLLVFALFFVLEMITGNVLEPLLYRQGTGVSEVGLLVCATFWASIWGPVGLILATPLTVCLVVSGKYVPPLAFFNRLLGDRPALKPYVSYLQRLLARDGTEAAAIAREYYGQHSPENTYDNLFVPALTLVRRDRASGAMDAVDEDFVVSHTEFFLQSRPSGPAGNSTSHAGSQGTSERRASQFVGLPANDRIDELSLRMLNLLLDPSGTEMDIVSTRRMPSDMIATVIQRQPRVVVVAALPPGGMSQACFLCESLREAMPDVVIIVGCWGVESNLDELILNLRAAGATYVTTTLAGGRSHMLSVLREQTTETVASRTA